MLVSYALATFQNMGATDGEGGRGGRKDICYQLQWQKSLAIKLASWKWRTCYCCYWYLHSCQKPKLYDCLLLQGPLTIIWGAGYSLSYCFSINVTAFKFHYQRSLSYIYSQNKIKMSWNKLWGFAMYSVQKSSLFKTTAFSQGVLFNRNTRHATPKGLGLSTTPSQT